MKDFEDHKKNKLGWSSKRFKYLADVRKGRLPSKPDSISEENKVAPYLSMDYLRNEDCTPDFVPVDKSSLEAKEGDILILWDGSNAGEFIRAKAGVVSSTAALVVPKKVQPSFLYWVCKAYEKNIQSETIGMGIPHVDGDFLSDLKIFVPENNEQIRIANYLDQEISRIDKLILAKERLLKLLAEKLRTLIVRIITNGLDSSVSFLDSQIPWLGKIPQHWKIWKLGHFASIGNGSTPDRDNLEYWVEGKIPWLNSSVVNQDEVKEADQFITEAAFRECHLPLVKSGSVLIAITGQGKTRGQAVVLSLNATINQHLVFITPNENMANSWFIRWILFAAHDFLRNISDDAGGTKGALTCEEISSLKIPLPPINEQRLIIDHISKEKTKLNVMHAVTERTINLLKERRAVLIDSVVTGQLKVI